MAKKNWISISVSALFALTLGFASTAQALDFKLEGTLLTISGREASTSDRVRLQDTLAKGGVQTVVMHGIGDGPNDIGYALGRLIEAAQVTTVIDGSCEGICPSLFMAGKQRLFMARSDADPRPPALILSATAFSFSGDAAQISRRYAYFSRLFSSTVPKELLSRYTSDGIDRDSLEFYAADDRFPEGHVSECITQITSDRTEKQCKVRSDMTSLTAGAITAAQLFVPPKPPGITPVTVSQFRDIRMDVYATRHRAMGGDSPIRLSKGEELEVKASVAWDLPGSAGSHTFSVDWFCDGRFVYTGAKGTAQMKQSPWSITNRFPGYMVGLGDCHVDFKVDDQTLTSRKVLMMP